MVNSDNHLHTHIRMSLHTHFLTYRTFPYLGFQPQQSFFTLTLLVILVDVNYGERYLN